ncbi:MAG: response regulator [Marinicellaceae bacterium]
MNREILLVEDDIELATLVRDYLTKNGFSVDMIHNGADAVSVIQQTQPDLVILDIMLPDKNGNEVCREVRSFYQGAILMLTALDDDMDQMLGLELGADDYIIKPVQPRLLLTRIRTILRRMNQNESFNNTIINAGELQIDSANRLVKVAEESIDLTSAEFELLLLLSQEIGQVVDRNTIVQELRGFEYDGLDRSIDRRISRLRKKLSANSKGELIKTVRGKGYQLCAGEK